MPATAENILTVAPATRREAAQKVVKETTNDLVYIFPIVVRVLSNGEWKLQQIEVTAENVEQAKAALEEDEEIRIVSALPGRPHPDCLSWREVFNLKLSAAFLGFPQDTMDKYNTWKDKDGKPLLPKSACGDPLFTRARLRHFAKAMKEKEDGSCG